VPNTAPFVLGVYNLRGDIIPIIDLRLFFNIEIPESNSVDLENLIIVTIDEQTFGVVVDSIEKVVAIHSSTIQPPHPLFGDINIKYIYGVVESNNRLYILLDIDRIFGTKAHVQSEQKLSLVKTTNDKVEVEPVSKKSAKDTKNAASKNLDLSFIVDSLAKLKKFNVTTINEQWVNARFVEWQEERKDKSLQFADEKDADLFLNGFYSPCNMQFWSKAYADLIYKCLPETTAKQINVWNIGCGKGYESFSLACLLKKRYPDARVRIYAHDTDLLCVSNAPLLTVPPAFASDWYAPYLTKTVSGDATFAQEIKDMILFEYHDCLHNNSLPDVDIIFCRDVVSFLDSQSQATVLGEFEEKLKGNGILILGQNEVLSSQTNWSVKPVGSVNVYSKR
jgi:purine-binding chemotaxis protein CheW